MKTFLVRFTNQHKLAKKDTAYEVADRFKRTDNLYIFLDGDGNVLAQYELAHVLSVSDISDVLPPHK